MLTFKEVDPSVLGDKYKAVEAIETFEFTEDISPVKKTEEVSEYSEPIPNQKVKADAGKPKLSLVPPQIIFDIAKVREYGNSKYPEGGTDNWKEVEIERYRDAAFRHLLSYIQDPKGVDEESGLSHLSHLACNIAFLCELER